MRHVAERLWVLLRDPEGPLVPYLDPFASALIAQGFNKRLISRQIRVTASFSQWLQDKQYAVQDITAEKVQQFFSESERQQPIRRGEVATLRRLIDFLIKSDVVHALPNAHETTPIQHVVEAFATYLRQEQALSERTLIQYCPFAERFLFERFGQGAVVLATLRAGDVIAFIKQQATQLSPARAKAATTALRSFLRYLRYSGEIDVDLASAVPTVPHWSMTGLPRAISPDHLQAVLAHCPRDTAVGRRDYAILLLLARLGLRAGEIVALTLDSIDWEIGAIAVVGKGDQATTLPLPIEVGEAISDYLRHGRPASSDRALFLRACAPVRGLGAQQSIGTIVAAAIKRAGVQTRQQGSHQFRHNLERRLMPRHKPLYVH